MQISSKLTGPAMVDYPPLDHWHPKAHNYGPPGSASFPSTSGFLGSAGAISSPWAGDDQRRSTEPAGQTASFYAVTQKKETNVLLCASF